jgi:hypothetical protein
VCVASESKGTRRSVRRKAIETSVVRNTETPNVKRRRDEVSGIMDSGDR